ncbi:MAG: CHAT domain-containing protein, partial [Cyanobacteria bacterium P01_D01_bin.50]
FPQYWATTQNNLGSAYTNRIKGDKADNIENAIAAYNAALEIYTRKDFPQDWAMTQNNLGEAYRNRIKGDKADNIEKAIAAYNAALEIRTRNDFPQDWAMTQNNLGNAYWERIKGDKADNIEKAIAAYNAALEIYTRKDFPQSWATTQNNLGVAYKERIKGDKAENIENAIAAYNAALEIRTRKDFPYEWAQTQNNLGIAYSERIKGDKADNIENAIAAYNAALEITTPKDFPAYWAGTQNNLGIAYSDRIKGDKAENIENAIASFEAALEVTTPTAIPIDCLQTAYYLGDLLFEIERWQQAINAYDKAIQAVELSRSWATDNTRRQEILENAINVYKNIVQACINNEQPEKAIEYAERSKARNLVELVYNTQLEPKGNIPQKQQVVNEFKLLRRQIEDEQRFLSRQTKAQDTNKDENQQLEASRQRLEELQQQLDELIKTKIQPYDPSFSLTQKVESIKFKEIQSLLDQNTAIIEWYLTNDKITAFLITPKPPVLFFGRKGGNINVWQSQPEDLEELIEWKDEYLGDYYNENKEKKKQWQDELEKRLAKLAEILHIDELIAQIPKNCDKLILIPHSFLHILPLHALEIQNIETSINQCLLELFPRGVSYAPSCQLLQLAQKLKRPDFQSLFGIQNPTKDLDFAELEVNCILSDFQQHQLLSEQQATKNNLSQNNPQLGQIHYLHFSCHGSFQPDSPLNSFLLLAAAFIPKIPDNADEQDYIELPNGQIIDLNECLTLRNLFKREIDLNQCRLVVLSACETGLIDFTSDEYIGLPSGFLYAGSASVVSSLWEVDDLSTAFLMIKFSQNIKAAIDKGEEISVVVALNQAQLWLKNVTKADLKTWTNQLDLNSNWKGVIRQQFLLIEDGIKPYHSPYYWAGFTAIGK